MTKQTERERFAGWLDADDLAHVRTLAAVETEGNVSQMVRKLVREALAAREAAK